jgi:hypothetical protein
MSAFSIDTRTPAEIEYDRQRLSRMPIADPTMGTDVTDEMIAAFERLEAAHPEAGMQEILTLLSAPDIPLSADEERALTILLAREPADTLLLALPDGSQVTGTHNGDGSPSCVHLQSADGQFYCDFDGVLSGDWADIYFEELTLEQVEKLRALFNSPLITALVDAARQWCKE